MAKTYDVSIIIPVYNASQWLDECFKSILIQTFNGSIEISIYNDGSKDNSETLILKWKTILESLHFEVTYSSGSRFEDPNGVGYAKNMAVKQSSGQYLCFLDADDVMFQDRIKRQYEAALKYPRAIIGCKFVRMPSQSTARYTKWANAIAPSQLYTQIYTSHGPTLLMPTWFCHRDIFDAVGGFSEKGAGVPEDLIFFHKHLSLGGRLFRKDDTLLGYRYHPEATTFSIHKDTIWDIQFGELEKKVLSKWSSFTIWNAGKQGRKFYRCLSEHNKEKVIAFCDVDVKKVKKAFYIYEESKVSPKPKIPIVHFTRSKPPFVLCVKMDLTNGEFEKNLKSLHLQEGKDFYHFS